MDSIAEFVGLLPSWVQSPLDAASQWAFYSLIFDFLSGEVETLRENLLGRTLAWVSAAALTLLTLWIVLQGYRIVSGQSRESMMALVTDSLRAMLIVSVATGMALGSTDLHGLLAEGLPNAITRIITGTDDPPQAMIDLNLAIMQVAMGSIDALHTGGHSGLEQDKDRALLFTGIGVAGPAVVGGALLLLYSIALALFVGFGPLFILSLLFAQTRHLFSQWLLYGIGTLFTLAVLSFVVALAMKLVLAVATAFAARYATAMAVGSSAEGISSLALQQGGLGLIMTVLIIMAPPIAALFFRGTLGHFSAYSQFGLGAGRPRWETQSGYQGEYHAALSSMPATDHRQLLGQAAVVGEDRIKPAAQETFLERYPEALAARAGGGVGSDLPEPLHATAAASSFEFGTAGHLAQDGHIYGARIEALEGVLAFQERARLQHLGGQLADHDYAAARHVASLGFYGEFDTAARAYAASVVHDPTLTMQEKYDRLSSLGARAIALAQNNGIDYYAGAGRRAGDIGDAVLDRHNLFDPSRPTLVYVDKPGDAGEPLRALLGVRPGEDINSLILNPQPGVTYAKAPGFLAQSEPWRDRYDLVGQVVQQGDVMRTVSGVIAKRTFDSVDELTGGGPVAGDWAYDKRTEDQIKWVARNDATLKRAEAGMSAVDFARDVYAHSQKDYITIDIFASKEDSNDRRFQVKTFAWRPRTNSFEAYEPLTNDQAVKKITIVRDR